MENYGYNQAQHQKIYNITKSTDDNNIISSLKLVIKRLESIKTYTSEPTRYLNTLEKIDEAKWLIKETQKLSSSDTSKLNQTIVDFQSLVATYEELVLEDNKKKKDKEYRLFTNNIFSEEETAEEFGRKSMKRTEEYKVVEYTQENLDDYWYTK